MVEVAFTVDKDSDVELRKRTMNKRKQYEKAEEIISSEIFDKMQNKRIFKVERYGSDFYIVEMCDEYFCVDLTKEMCQELSRAFGELADCFEDAEESRK